MPQSAETINVLFVCMGNICRSPTAEGVFRALVEEAGLGAAIGVDSAGTHAYHVGSPPDRRSQATARQRGVDLSALRGRVFEAEDFRRFDFLLAMDGDNLRNMRSLAPIKRRGEAELLLNYADGVASADVPDPYYGDDGFDLVFDLIDNASRGLLRHIRKRHDL